jgi:hypothetical protein
VRSDGLGAPSSLSLTITGTSPVPGGEIAPSSRTREPEFPSHWPTMGGRCKRRAAKLSDEIDYSAPGNLAGWICQAIHPHCAYLGPTTKTDVLSVTGSSAIR